MSSECDYNADLNANLFAVSQEETPTTKKSFMESLEATGPNTQGPTSKVVPLMDTCREPVAQAEKEGEEYAECGKEKKHHRPKKLIRNVFTRMQGNVR